MDLTRAWIAEYVAQCGGSAKHNRGVARLLLRYYANYRQGRPERGPSELFNRTDSLIQWAQARNWKTLSNSTARDELIAVRSFVSWLFRAGRTDDNVYHYLRPRTEAILSGDIPRIWLRHNLQRDIANFRETLVLKNQLIQLTAVQAAHSWNLHLNRYFEDRETVEVDEELLLSWLGRPHEQAPSVRRAANLLNGLGMFLEYLVALKKIAGDPVVELLLRGRRRSAFRIATVVTSAGTSSAAVLRDQLGQLELFQSGLKNDFRACLSYLQAQKMVVKPYANAFGCFDRVLRRAGVERAEDITTEVIEAFLSENQASPGTRNSRLVKCGASYSF